MSYRLRRHNPATGNVLFAFAIEGKQPAGRTIVRNPREDIRSTKPGQSASDVPAEALAQFLAGALFGVLMWWIGRKTQLSVADVNALFRKLAIPAVKAAAR